MTSRLACSWTGAGRWGYIYGDSLRWGGACAGAACSSKGGGGACLNAPVVGAGVLPVA